MSIRHIDHVAITVADIEVTIAFYRDVLGAEVLLYDLWREGKIPVVLLQLGGSRLSVHAASGPAKPHARASSWARAGWRSGRRTSSPATPWT